MREDGTGLDMKASYEVSYEGGYGLQEVGWVLAVPGALVD